MSCIGILLEDKLLKIVKKRRDAVVSSLAHSITAFNVWYQLYTTAYRIAYAEELVSIAKSIGVELVIENDEDGIPGRLWVAK